MAQLLEEMSSGEITEWMAFSRVEPFGGAIDDLRAGLGPAVTVNVNRAPDTDPISALDFYPWHIPEPEPVKIDTPEEIARKLRAYLNARVKPDGNV